MSETGYRATDDDLPAIFFEPRAEVPASRVAPWSENPDWVFEHSLEEIAEAQRRFSIEHDVEPNPVGESGAIRARQEPRYEEPNWDDYRDAETGRLGFRAQVSHLLWTRGLKAKAVRFLSCNKCGRPGVCARFPDEHKYFLPNGCEVAFCRGCAEEVRRELTLAYLGVVCRALMGLIGAEDEYVVLLKVASDAHVDAGGRQAVEVKINALWEKVRAWLRQNDWVLARVNFTLRSDGSEIIPERVKKFNACVRTVMRATTGSRSGFGMLFVDEVGFEKRGHLPDSQRAAHGLNLHAHGLYLGPRLDWERTRDLWVEETRKRFEVESRGFFITRIRGFDQNPERAVRWALNHMLKYVSKPPAVTPERLASLIAAFDGARRVHSLGLFYGKKSERKKKDCPCPKCRADGILSVIEFEGRGLPDGGCVPRLAPVEELRAAGYVALRDAGRNAVLAMGMERARFSDTSP